MLTDSQRLIGSDGGKRVKNGKRVSVLMTTATNERYGRNNGHKSGRHDRTDISFKKIGHKHGGKKKILAQKRKVINSVVYKHKTKMKGIWKGVWVGFHSNTDTCSV